MRNRSPTPKTDALVEGYLAGHEMSRAAERFCEYRLGLRPLPPLPIRCICNRIREDHGTTTSPYHPPAAGG